MPRQFSKTHTYSASIQEAMRHNKLSSSNYNLAMTILNAVSHGYSEAQWQEENQRMLKTLADLPLDKNAPHADAENRYEQSLSNLKDLALWPW